MQLLIDALRYRRARVGLALFLFIVAVAVVGPYLAPYSPVEFVTGPYAKPSSVAPLGGDSIGRDVLSRVLYGGRSVLVLAFIATAIGMLLGIALGLFAGYSRAAIDDLVMRVLDALLAFPEIIFVLLLVSVVGPRLWLIVLTVGLSHAPRVARVARGCTLDTREQDFVKAAESLGVSRVRIAFGEILPAITSPSVRGVRPAAHLLDRPHRGALLPRLRHAAAGGRLGPHDQREPARSRRSSPTPSSSRWRSSPSSPSA